jgi:hypothetical protein
MALSAAAAIFGVVLAATAPVPISTVVPPVPVTDTPETVPPAGSAQDQALWRSGREAQTESLIEQDRARRLLDEVRSAKLQDRLVALRGSGGHETAEEAGERLEKLETAGDETYRLAAAPPFDLRTGCRYEIIRLGQAMDPASPASKELPQARKDLATCRDALDRYRKPLRGASERLEAEIARASELLARHEAVRADPAAQAQSGQKAP